MSAKTMAAQYKRMNKSSTLSPLTNGTSRFKSSTSNLANNNNNNKLTQNNNNGTKSRLKSTSMTNLVVANEDQNSTRNSTNNLSSSNHSGKLQRPASRSALDSIHNGMNAKYAQVQSKVLLQNIRPQANGASASSKIPASKENTLTRRSVTPHGRQQNATGAPTKVPNDRTVLINRLKSQQEDLEKLEQERESLKLELEREKNDKQEQIQQLKLEIQEKLAEHDKQNEEYHQKLMDAYELADQNRRAADNVISESRQKDEESRKKIEELEQQLAELKEFVAMKEEMSNKMFELREQIRQERERYEEQLKSLHQVFENEKIRLEMDLMEKVRQVGENYELNKYKSLNKTIELDARLANERLIATKLRLSQVNNNNDKLSKQLRLLQQQFQSQEKKLLVAETMLKQLVDSGNPVDSSRSHHKQLRSQASATIGGSRIANRLTGRPKQVAGKTSVSTATMTALAKGSPEADQHDKEIGSATGTPAPSDSKRQVSTSATQTQASRTKNILNDIRQRLNLAPSGSNRKATAVGVNSLVLSSAGKSDMAIQTGSPNNYQVGYAILSTAAGEWQDLADADATDNGDHQLLGADRSQIENHLQFQDTEMFQNNAFILNGRVQVNDTTHSKARQQLRRRRSVSLNDIIESSFVHEAASGERIIISRGWPNQQVNPKSKSKSKSKLRPEMADSMRFSSSDRHRRKSLSLNALASQSKEMATFEDTKHETHRRSNISSGHKSKGKKSRSSSSGSRRQRIDEDEKRRLLVEFLHRSSGNISKGNQLAPLANKSGQRRASMLILPTSEKDQETGESGGRVLAKLVLADDSQLLAGDYRGRSSSMAKELLQDHRLGLNKRLGDVSNNGIPERYRPLLVQYDLPVHSGAPIPLS